MSRRKRIAFRGDLRKRERERERETFETFVLLNLPVIPFPNSIGCLCTVGTHSPSVPANHWRCHHFTALVHAAVAFQTQCNHLLVDGRPGAHAGCNVKEVARAEAAHTGTSKVPAFIPSTHPIPVCQYRYYNTCAKHQCSLLVGMVVIPAMQTKVPFQPSNPNLSTIMSVQERYCTSQCSGSTETDVKGNVSHVLRMWKRSEHWFLRHFLQRLDNLSDYRARRIPILSLCFLRLPPLLLRCAKLQQ